MDPLINLSLGEQRLKELRADASEESRTRMIRLAASAERRAPWRRALGRMLISGGQRIAGDARYRPCD
jgi:hypothetical protein